MASDRYKVLVVDDEPLNLMIISEYLQSADDDYQWDTAEDGEQAWNLLVQAPERYNAVLLDRMMPRMDGMQVLNRIREHPLLKEVPVILQTARTADEDIAEGISAGAYYYLTKPYQEDQLISIVRAAVHDHVRYLTLKRELDQKNAIFQLMQSCQFRFRTLEEARFLSSLMAQACPSPETAVTGLLEIMVNAVEHGNLGITYDEKGDLNNRGQWENEVKRRLALPEMRDRYVEVEFLRKQDEIHVRIKDQGDGFNHEPFLEISVERGSHNHGRGIALARMISFERLEYMGKGNEVLAVIRDSQ